MSDQAIELVTEVKQRNESRQAAASRVRISDGRLADLPHTVGVKGQAKCSASICERERIGHVRACDGLDSDRALGFPRSKQPTVLARLAAYHDAPVLTLLALMLTPGSSLDSRRP